VILHLFKCFKFTFFTCTSNEFLIIGGGKNTDKMYVRYVDDFIKLKIILIAYNNILYVIMLLREKISEHTANFE